MDRTRWPVLLLVALLAGCGSGAQVTNAPQGGSGEPSLAPAGGVTASPAVPTPSASVSSAALPPALPARTVKPIAVIETGLQGKQGDLAGFVNSITVAGGAIWLGSPAGLVRADPATNTASVVDTDAGANVSGLGDDVWRTAFYFNAVSRYDATSGRRTLRIDLPGALGVLATESLVWVTGHNDGMMVALDRRTGRTVSTRPLASPGNAGPGDVVSAAGALWVVVPRDRSVVKVDPLTGAVLQTIVLDLHPSEHLRFAGGALWAGALDWEGEPAPAPGTLIRIDPATGRATTSIVPEDHGEVVDVEGEPWLPAGDTMVLLDRESGRPLRAVRMGIDGYHAFTALNALAGVWVASQEDSRLVLLAPSSLRPVGG